MLGFMTGLLHILKSNLRLLKTFLGHEKIKYCTQGVCSILTKKKFFFFWSQHYTIKQYFTGQVFECIYNCINNAMRLVFN